MNGKFKRTTSVNGKITDVRTNGEAFVDEDGCKLDLCEILYNIYGDNAFDISTTLKDDEEIE